MFSILNRIRACVLVRVLVVLFVAGLVWMTAVPSALGRQPEAREEVAGDGEGVGGFKEEIPGGASANPLEDDASLPRTEAIEVGWMFTLKTAWLMFLKPFILR
jgi:hypothetical protein